MRRAYQKQIEQMERDNMYKQQHQHFPGQFNNNPTDPLMGGYNRSVLFKAMMTKSIGSKVVLKEEHKVKINRRMLKKTKIKG